MGERLTIRSYNVCTADRFDLIQGRPLERLELQEYLEPAAEALSDNVLNEPKPSLEPVERLEPLERYEQLIVEPLNES